MKAEHPDYKRVVKLGEALGELAVNYNMVELQDSLQHLSTLSEEEQLEIVEKIIEEVKKEEEEAARLAKSESASAFETQKFQSLTLSPAAFIRKYSGCSVKSDLSIRYPAAWHSYSMLSPRECA
mgnify:CR=1 FL=1